MVNFFTINRTAKIKKKANKIGKLCKFKNKINKIIKIKNTLINLFISLLISIYLFPFFKCFYNIANITFDKPF